MYYMYLLKEATIVQFKLIYNLSCVQYSLYEFGTLTGVFQFPFQMAFYTLY